MITIGGYQNYFIKKYTDAVETYSRTVSKAQTYRGLPKYFVEMILVIFIVLYLSLSMTILKSESDINSLSSMLMLLLVIVKIIPSISSIISSNISINFSWHIIDIIYHKFYYKSMVPVFSSEYIQERCQ